MTHSAGLTKVGPAASRTRRMQGKTARHELLAAIRAYRESGGIEYKAVVSRSFHRLLDQPSGDPAVDYAVRVVHYNIVTDLANIRIKVCAEQEADAIWRQHCGTIDDDFKAGLSMPPSYNSLDK